MAQPLSYEPARGAMDALLASHFVRRIWQRDVSAWTAAGAPADADQVGRTIANRLGWLDAPTAMQPELDAVLAVTDPGTGLAQLAQQRGYRHTFINPPDIGGRFSALSLFGLVPAALIGAPVRDMLAGAADMAEGCKQENHQNPGLELGAFIGAAA